MNFIKRWETKNIKKSTKELNINFVEKNEQLKIIFQHSIYIYFMYIKIVVKFYSINNNKVEKKKTNEKEVKT